MSDRKKAIETLKENLCAMCAYGFQNMESCDIRSCDNRDAIKALEQEPRWIPVSERVAEFPCLACDIFGQIFIPFAVVTLNNRCFDGKEFDFDVEKFLKGKEVTLFSGEKVYELPKEIVAWMPLPQPYKGVEE